MNEQQKSERETIEHLMNKGLEHLRRDECRQAFAYFRMTIAVAPTFDVPYIFASRALGSLGDEQGAIEVLKEGLSRKETFDLRDVLATVYAACEQDDKAVVEFQRALELNPESFLTATSLGAAYMRLRKMDEARASLNRALEIREEFSGALAQLAVIAKMNRDYDTAMQYFQRAIVSAQNDNKPELVAHLESLMEQTRQAHGG